MATYVCDLEGDSLTPIRIHCIGCQDVRGHPIHTTTSYENMRKLFSNPRHTFILHNGKRFDMPVMERILGIKIKARVIDTLFLSWYLEPDRPKHGLDSYGDEAGIPKPPIEDWENLPIEEYIHRVTEDVKINMYVYKKQLKQLLKLYDNNMEEVNRFIDFLMFHADVAVNQEKCGWKLDIDRCTKVLAKLQKDQVHSFKELEKAMPQVPVYVKKTLPKRDKFKMNGDVCADWVKWYKLLDSLGLPHSHTQDVKVLGKPKPPNAGSVPQLKDWCFSLGWKPTVFKYERNKKTGVVKKIPQLRVKTDDGPELAPCVSLLLAKEPKLHLVADLGVITHRISVLNGFMNSVDEDVYVKAQMQGLTNTLRWKHRIVLNLPGIDKPYGEDIRGCLVCDEDETLLGTDICSLEDCVKRHYMVPHDPEYVAEMQHDGYDPHTALAVFAGAMSKQQQEDKSGNYRAIRKVFKCVNYACQYGAQGPTVARAAGVSEREGIKLVADYQRKNWSIQVIADEQITKRCLGRTWLYNPVNRFWYSLRHKKDIFSTLAQGTGAYIFMVWCKHMYEMGLPIIMSMHDEVCIRIKKHNKERAKEAVLEAMRLANEELNLNEEIKCDIQYGSTYAEIH